MKYLLVLVIVLVALWLWRNNRRIEKKDAASAPKPSSGEPQDMVQCPVCSIHLPRTDALPGPDGQLYCCQEHRVRAGHG